MRLTQSGSGKVAHTEWLRQSDAAQLAWVVIGQLPCSLPPLPPNTFDLLMRLIILLCGVAAASVVHAETLVYFGTYTRGNSTSEGIYVAKLNESSGEMSSPELAAKADSPSFVAIHPDGKTLYAVSENSAEGPQAVGVLAYRIESDGLLTKISEQSTGGAAACHVAVDPTGKCLGVANYSGGSCASFAIQSDGSIDKAASIFQHVGSSVNPRRQTAPHAHSINFSKDGSRAFVADLGMDAILIYDVDLKTGKMRRAEQGSLKLPAGGGPRHFSLSPSEDRAVTNLEMTSAVVLLKYDGQLTILDDPKSTLPANESQPNNSTAECLFHPSGTFFYVSNRGHNSIAGFRLSDDGRSTIALGQTSTRGEIPRGFGITPDGKFLVAANQKSGNIVSFRIDSKTGMLTPTGSEINVGSPVNVRFLKR